MVQAVVTILILLLLCTSVRAAPACVDAQTREQIRALIYEGLEQGFRNHVEHLFDIWVKDGGEEQPKRTVKGMQNVINAYARARKVAAMWQPPLSCS